MLNILVLETLRLVVETVHQRFNGHIKMYLVLILAEILGLRRLTPIRILLRHLHPMRRNFNLEIYFLRMAMLKCMLVTAK